MAFRERPHLGIPPELAVITYSFLNPELKDDCDTLLALLEMQERCFSYRAVLFDIYHQWFSSREAITLRRDQIRTRLRDALVLQNKFNDGIRLFSGVEIMCRRKGYDLMLKRVIESAFVPRSKSDKYDPLFRTALRARNFEFCKVFIEAFPNMDVFKDIALSGDLSLVAVYCKLYSGFNAPGQLLHVLVSLKDARNDRQLIDQILDAYDPEECDYLDDSLCELIRNPEASVVCEALLCRGVRQNQSYKDLCFSWKTMRIVRIMDRALMLSGKRHPSFYFSENRYPEPCIKAYYMKWESELDVTGLDEHVFEYVAQGLCTVFEDPHLRHEYVYDVSIDAPQVKQRRRYIAEHKRRLTSRIRNKLFRRHVAGTLTQEETYKLFERSENYF